jgi:hypothetical protein
MNDFRDAVLTQ